MRLMPRAGAGVKPDLGWRFPQAPAPTKVSREAVPNPVPLGKPDLALNQVRADYGHVMPLGMGRRRPPGQILWASEITTLGSGATVDLLVSSGYNGDEDPDLTTPYAVWANGTKIWQDGTALMPGSWSVDFKTGTDDQAAFATYAAAVGSDAAVAYRGQSLVMLEALPLEPFNYAVPAITVEWRSDDSLTVRAFIEEIAERAGLDPDEDLSFAEADNLTDALVGALVHETESFADILRRASRYAGFEMFAAETIRFVRPVASGGFYLVDITLPPEDLLFTSDRSLTLTRREENLEPLELALHYIDFSQQYHYSTQRSRRVVYPTRSTGSRRKDAFTVPFVVSAGTALKRCAQAMFREAVEKNILRFQLSPKYLRVEPGDILNVTVGADTFDVIVRRVEIGPDFQLGVEASMIWTDHDVDLDADGGFGLSPSITSESSASIPENAALAHTLTADQTVTWSVVGGADQAKFEVSGSTLRWLSNGTKDYETPDDADVNNTYIVTVRATNAGGGYEEQTLTVTVFDVIGG